ncbi:hypothetical protein G7Y89_g1358 [Cudoniella acicularis]|uniref:Uncharacterized protein n=1 Tax=Cudoniella acicularis TaxID=354080 RepID=A0A8H4RW84_9HELO|nr:hypothetical protein G7Y89_g1358 [Cudoniella acicularis]
MRIVRSVRSFNCRRPTLVEDLFELRLLLVVPTSWIPLLAVLKQILVRVVREFDSMFACWSMEISLEISLSMQPADGTGEGQAKGPNETLVKVYGNAEDGISTRFSFDSNERNSHYYNKLSS